VVKVGMAETAPEAHKVQREEMEARHQEATPRAVRVVRVGRAVILVAAEKVGRVAMLAQS
jgi:hypothetical protein